MSELESRHYLANGSKTATEARHAIEWAGETRAQMVDLKFCDLLGSWQHMTLPVAAFAEWTDAASLPIIAIDNVEGSLPLPDADLPEACVLLFGQEGPGLSPEALAAASGTVQIEQYGSTRSINASAAAAVVMYEWCRRWA